MGNEALTNVIAAAGITIAAGAAAVASFLSWWATRTARKAAEAQLLSQFMEKYATDRMHGDLKLLGEHFPFSNETEWAAVYNDEKWHHPTEKAQADAANNARRNVGQFFLSAVRLHRGGFAGKKFMYVICECDGVLLFCGRVREMYRLRDPDYNEDLFNRMDRLCKILRAS